MSAGRRIWVLIVGVGLEVDEEDMADEVVGGMVVNMKACGGGR